MDLEYKEHIASDIKQRRTIVDIILLSKALKLKVLEDATHPYHSATAERPCRPRSLRWPMIRTIDDKSSVEEPTAPKKGFKGEAYTRKLQGIYDEVAEKFYGTTVELGEDSKDADLEMDLALINILTTCEGESFLILIRDCAALGYNAENVAGFPATIADFKLFDGVLSLFYFQVCMIPRAHAASLATPQSLSLSLPTPSPQQLDIWFPKRSPFNT